MKTKWLGFMTMAFGLLYATPLLAASSAAPATTGGTPGWVVPVAAAFSMAIVGGLCGLGQGKATAAACEGVARNPGARPGIMLFLILGLIFIESLDLYVFAIVAWKVK